MAEPDKKTVTLEELLFSSLAQIDALAKLLIEKELITEKSLCRRFPMKFGDVKPTLIFSRDTASNIKYVARHIPPSFITRAIAPV